MVYFSVISIQNEPPWNAYTFETKINEVEGVDTIMVCIEFFIIFSLLLIILSKLDIYFVVVFWFNPYMSFGILLFIHHDVKPWFSKKFNNMQNYVNFYNLI